jgi:hypothetical protein
MRPKKTVFPLENLSLPQRGEGAGEAISTAHVVSRLEAASLQIP